MRGWQETCNSGLETEQVVAVGGAGRFRVPTWSLRSYELRFHMGAGNPKPTGTGDPLPAAHTR